MSGHGPECDHGRDVVHTVSTSASNVPVGERISGCCLGCRKPVEGKRVDRRVSCGSCKSANAERARRFFDERCPFDTETFVPSPPSPYDRFAGSSRQGERLHGWGRR